MVGRRWNAALLGGMLGAALAAPVAEAAYTVTLAQVGGNVVATGSGSLDLSSLANGGDSTQFPTIGTTNGNSFVFVGGSPDGTTVTSFNDSLSANPVSGPAMFGVADDYGFADSGTGDLVGLIPVNLFASDGNSALYVPQGYVSGAPLTSSATWQSTTIDGLGLFPGTYVWTWGAGPSADSFTLVITAPPGTPRAGVPEPGTVLLLGAGLLGLAGVRCPAAGSRRVG